MNAADLEGLYDDDWNVRMDAIVAARDLEDHALLRHERLPSLLEDPAGAPRQGYMSVGQVAKMQFNLAHMIELLDHPEAELKQRAALVLRTHIDPSWITGPIDFEFRVPGHVRELVKMLVDALIDSDDKSTHLQVLDLLALMDEEDLLANADVLIYELSGITPGGLYSGDSHATLYSDAVRDAAHKLLRRVQKVKAASDHQQLQQELQQEMVGMKRQLAEALEQLKRRKDTDERLQEHLKCPICLSEFEDPHMITSCRHDFCYACLKQHFDHRSDKCPTCQQPARWRDVKKSHRLSGIIADIRGVDAAVPAQEAEHEAEEGPIDLTKDD